MAEKKDPKFVSEFLDRLTCFLTSEDNRTMDEVREDLKAEGIDPDRVIERGRKLVAKKLDERRLSWQAKAREERLSVLKNTEKVEVAPIGGEGLKEKVKTMLSGMHGRQTQQFAQAYFRKLEQVTEKDMQSFLEDLERLKMLEKLSNEEEDK
jgi:2-succinyl-5-enolpyruvyl-6-hydroxy-3-cyclohexene-1-carboxylate synthase